MKWYSKIILLPFLLILAACGLSSEVEKRAEQLQGSLTGLSQLLDKQQKDFVALQANKEMWAFFAPYAEREKWNADFATAGADLKGLQDRYKVEVRTLLDADKEEDEQKLVDVLTALEANLKPIETEIKAVDGRMSLLRTGYENAPQWIEKARQNLTALNVLLEKLTPVMVQTKADFPSRVADIDERSAPFKKLVADSAAQLQAAEAEYAKHQASSEADYARFADAVAFLDKAALDAAALDASYRDDLLSLYKDYTQVLRDMKVEYYVTIARASWDDSSDWNNTPDYTYAPVAVSQADFEYLSGLTDTESTGAQGDIASYYSSWGSWTVHPNIDAAVWGRFGIDPGASWTSGDDNSQFWIEDLEPRYFHKYAEVTGTKVVEGDWEEVDEEEYAQHVDDFGMAIESKVLGQFQDEAVAEAVPVGMEMVGDARYGEWQQDSTGNSFWHYYGQYAFFNSLLGNDRYYYRSDYDDYRAWRRDRTSGAGVYGWYGMNRTTPVWGSSGSYTTQTATYKGSPFGKSGGAKAVSPGLRDAGKVARSRGPGEGGK